MSNLFNINLKDVGKGIVTAVLASVILFLYNASINHTVIDWQQLLQVAEAAGLGYVVKNFLSDDQGKFLGKF